MPSVHLYGPYGESPIIASRNWAMVANWMHEWLPCLWPADAPEEIGPVRAVVQPIMLCAGDEPDWHADTRIISQLLELPRDPGAAVERLTWLKDHPEELLPGQPGGKAGM